jgi:hypothetical protein
MKFGALNAYCTTLNCMLVKLTYVVFIMERESIIDFKQSNKPKREEYIGDYYLQLAAYATAHDAIYDTKIEQGVILMCTPDLYFQKFVINGARFRQYKWEWLRRLDEYYKKISQSK